MIWREFFIVLGTVIRSGGLPQGVNFMKKMLVADNAEMNKSIVHEIFASQYEVMETASSEAVFRLLM